jgi:AraC-like DNA-binding protein
MSAGHDQTSGSVAVASDPLSDVLRTVKLTGALLFLADASSPWCVDVPHADRFRAALLPRAQHIISYHVAVEGSGYASVPGHQPVRFAEGDIIVFPHADPYRMESAPGVPPELDPAQTLQFLADMAAGRLPFVIKEGGGGWPPARLLCGFLGCDARPFNPLLATLPRLMHVRRPPQGEDRLLGRLIALTLAEARYPRAGGEAIRLRLSELMFVEVVRGFLDSAPAEEAGWLRGLRDPIVGRALALLHARPAYAWTLPALAQEIGVSRSVLAERFAQLTGQPPMRYLALWRIQLAARLLSDSGAKVSAVAAEAGYASEAAFSRTFKRIAGMSPSAWRDRFEPGG